jgi:hypothetical protein
MAGVFDKLQLKDQREIVVLNAPASFEPELATLRNVSVVRAVKDAKDVMFSIAFVKTQPELGAAVKGITGKAKGDAVVWFAYPKQSSKRYASTINRDSGWDSLGKAGFEPVRMVAIDEDWSALRFRRADFIKTMKRDATWAMSKVGKAKASRKPVKRKGT